MTEVLTIAPTTDNIPTDILNNSGDVNNSNDDNSEGETESILEDAELKIKKLAASIANPFDTVKVRELNLIRTYLYIR